MSTMANYQQDDHKRQSALQSLLNMFHLSSPVATKLSAEGEVEGDLDEPPDEGLHLQDEPMSPRTRQQAYTKCAPPPMERKVSLITRALRSAPNSDVQSPLASPVSGAFSRTSTFSNASMPSTAELTSDADDKSPARSASSSPPLPTAQVHQLAISEKPPLPPSRISFVDSKDPARTAAPDSHDSVVEANLGRRRLITFACSGKPSANGLPPAKEEIKEAPQPPKRKCMLTFACPARPDQKVEHAPVTPSPRRDNERSSDGEGPTPLSSDKAPNTALKSSSVSTEGGRKAILSPPLPSHITGYKSPEVPAFQEFAVRDQGNEDWACEPIDSGHKLTLSDLMKKENAIRRIAEEAEEEAEQEQDEQDELDGEPDDGDNEDDFAPSDDGNESDNEAGFADSDDDSDTHPDDQFWVPFNVTAIADHNQPAHFRPKGRRRQSGNSTDSFSDHDLPHQPATESINIKYSGNHRSAKVGPLRPSTPDLPDSTDFVCGTLDEDRPLEAAYKSSLEQRKLKKHIPIPQDIDPSFPTSDPEDLDEEDDEDLDLPDEPITLKSQPVQPENVLKRHDSTHHIDRKPSVRSPRNARSPVRQVIHRSPPPPRSTVRRASPAPKGRLFGKSPRRLLSPPPTCRLKSPPGTRRQSSTDASPLPHHGLAIGGLAHRPTMTRTSSLPRTPNPFFHNYRPGKQERYGNASAEDTSTKELHVRGPVDIVIGLEKKRQKRKEKFWRQHCRKAAREQLDRKPIPGRGAERMRELGLECAERNRAYGLGQQPALVISL